MTVSRLVSIHIDLTGSRLGDEWRAVDVELTQMPGAEDEALRRDAAEHYGVALDQVGAVVPVDGERR